MNYTIEYPAPEGWGKIIALASDESGGAVLRLAWVDIAALHGIGQEFINNADHGRLMQCSLVFDGKGEADNPTEGGSRLDGPILHPSTSRALIRASGNVIETMCRMAYWNPVDGALRSNVTLRKRFTLGYRGVWNAIEVVNTIDLPGDRQFSLAQFENLTAYMPPEFSVFDTLNLATGVLTPIDAEPAGEQPLPLVFSTPDGKWAMGAFAPGGTPGGGYGLWRFGGDCVKWNAVTRQSNPPAGATLTGRMVCAIGCTDNVIETLCGLAAREVPQPTQ